MKWFKDAWKAAKTVRRMRRLGVAGELLVMEQGQADYQPEEDYLEIHKDDWNRLLVNLKEHKDSYQLAYDCIEALRHGKSCCPFCMEYEHCADKQHKGKIRGCPEWVLGFPDSMKGGAENEQSSAATGAGEKGAGQPEAQEAELSRSVSGEDA